MVLEHLQFHHLKALTSHRTNLGIRASAPSLPLVSVNTTCSDDNSDNDT